MKGMFDVVCSVGCTEVVHDLKHKGQVEQRGSQIRHSHVKVIQNLRHEQRRIPYNRD